ncbi:MAG TPA: hypothetical protein VF210_17450 [Pseudomonadales bacterium]
MDTRDGDRTAPQQVLPRTFLDPAFADTPLPRLPEADRSLLYLHFEGLDGANYSAVGRSLERLSRRLWGSPTLVPLGASDFALTLEGWSAVRCQQLCGILERAFEGGLQRLGEGVRMQVRVEAVGRPRRVERQ